MPCYRIIFLLRLERQTLNMMMMNMSFLSLEYSSTVCGSDDGKTERKEATQRPLSSSSARRLFLLKWSVGVFSGVYCRRFRDISTSSTRAHYESNARRLRRLEERLSSSQAVFPFGVLRTYSFHWQLAAQILLSL